MNPETISIQSYEELLEKMKSQEFSVSWRVTSDVGPDWIGSWREITFSMSGVTLTKTPFILTLEKNIIDRVPIPEKSKDYVIYGRGDLMLTKNLLAMEFDWEAAYPYDEAHFYADGKICIYP